MIQVLKSDYAYDLRRLKQEVAVARGILDFDKGPYGNCISLPASTQIKEPFTTHRNNVPFTDALEYCPYLKDIFDYFQTEKTSFRLLRRGPQTAYAFHDDNDRGVNILRLQIPIFTSAQAFLVLVKHELDLSLFHPDPAGFQGDDNGDIWFDMEKMDRAWGGQVVLFHLQAGFLHYFDTSLVHTLINAANKERITLGIDLVKNDWLEDWMQTHMKQTTIASPIRPSSAIQWKWNSLRYGIIRTA